jgi:hypothetical protein
MNEFAIAEVPTNLVVPRQTTSTRLQYPQEDVMDISLCLKELF